MICETGYRFKDDVVDGTIRYCKDCEYKKCFSRRIKGEYVNQGDE